MKHISENMTAVCKEHGITMNQGDREMNDTKRMDNVDVLDALGELFDAVCHDKGETEMLTSLGVAEKLLFEAGKVTRRYYKRYEPRYTIQRRKEDQ